MNNIIFIGGIHGVGKSTACKSIIDKFPLEHLSASSLLKWEELNADVKNKKVENISLTQDRLIIGLQNTVSEDKKYLLDGHFCLFNSTGEVSEVPLSTFESINPILLIVVTCDPEIIKQRLNSRDSKNYSTQELSTMQDREVEYSGRVADHLKIRCIYTESVSLEQVFKEIHELI